MNQIIRVSLKSALVALAVAIPLAASAQPDPTKATPAAIPAPAPTREGKPPGTPGGPPTFMPASGTATGFTPNAPFPAGSGMLTPSTNVLPKYLEGVMTLEEYQSLMKFQQQVNDDQESKDLIAQLTALNQQVRQLQTQLSKHRAQALADNPQMKAIADKMQDAMRAHTSMPFMPTAMTPGAPAPATTKPPTSPSISLTPAPKP